MKDVQVALTVRAVDCDASVNMVVSVTQLTALVRVHPAGKVQHVNDRVKLDTMDLTANTGRQYMSLTVWSGLSENVLLGVQRGVTQSKGLTSKGRNGCDKIPRLSSCDKSRRKVTK